MISATVIGNVANPELRDAGGTPVLSFSLASNEKGKNGVEAVSWVRVNVWGDRATKLSQYVVKGKKIAACGQLSNRSYEKNGETRTSLELKADGIEFLDKKGDGTTETKSDSSPTQGASDDTDIPF